jgi:hypothetical protein
MRKMLVVGILATAVVMVVAFSAPVATGQSSGNFAAKIGTSQCVVNDTSGALSGGLTVTALETTIKTRTPVLPRSICGRPWSRGSLPRRR